ncbi:hypothetical protein [Pontibaca methylaminivorans]|uniref:hypothetical protein n=1 Tax=Pontibaca methylaminivorans TaxID=515897 RepID=UPI002FDB77B6
MWGWLADNSTAVQAVTGIVTALVWVVYLQILVSGFRRQRRSIILIYGAGNDNIDPRIFVSNLGFESIYILEILLAVRTCDGWREMSITDRTEVAPDKLASPSETSVQGPLASGAWVDIGSTGDLLARMSRFDTEMSQNDLIEHIRITVAAVTAATTGIVAAEMDFAVRPYREDGRLQLKPQRLHATQIRSRAGRREIARRLGRRLGRDEGASEGK